METIIEDIGDELLSKLLGPDKNDCWLWEGKVSLDGYGIFECEGYEFQAHRSAKMVLEPGWVYKHQDVIHICDNKLCCNPKHLRIVDKVKT